MRLNVENRTRSHVDSRYMSMLDVRDHRDQMQLAYSARTLPKASRLSSEPSVKFAEHFSNMPTLEARQSIISYDTAKSLAEGSIVWL